MFNCYSYWNLYKCAIHSNKILKFYDKAFIIFSYRLDIPVADILEADIPEVDIPFLGHTYSILENTDLNIDLMSPFKLYKREHLYILHIQDRMHIYFQ